MGLLSSLADAFSGKGKASSLYKRGMKKAQSKDFEGAIADYTTVIEMDKGPPDVQAMALFNRALAHSSCKDYGKARKDYDLVLALPSTPATVKTKAKEKLFRLDKRVSNLPEPHGD